MQDLGGGVVHCGEVEGGAVIIVFHVNRPRWPVAAPSWSVSVCTENGLEELYCGEVIPRDI